MSLLLAVIVSAIGVIPFAAKRWTLVGLAMNLFLSVLLFKYAHIVTGLLGKKGSVAFARVMGLILIAIGVEFIRNTLFV